MIYVVEDSNLNPNVREQLWLRSSGAHQLMKSYDGYPVGFSSAANQDYYQLLENSPLTPNPSVGMIKADFTRINFDLDVVSQSHRSARIDKDLLN